MVSFLYTQPRKFFYKKPFKRKVYNTDKILRVTTGAVNWDYYGLQAQECGRLKYYQVEAVRKIFASFFKNETGLVIRLQFNSPVTTKSLGVRMGRGKGKLANWLANVKKRQIVFELSKQIVYNNIYKMPEILKTIKERIPLRLKLVYLKIY